MEILPLNRERIQDANPTNEPFAMIGRLVPTYAEGKWRWTEELLAVPREKVYEDEARDWTEYIAKPDKAIFLCYLNGQCAGRIVLHEAWNRYAFIEDLDVKRAFRRQGVGTALMEPGQALGQGTRLGRPGAGNAGYEPDRLRFYQKCGLEIGAVNTMLYKNMPAPACEDIAIFWYLKFPETDGKACDGENGILCKGNASGLC